MEGLHAFTAGAGTGKTTKICDILADKLTGENNVDPEAVLATTFTKRAASDLKSRAQARVLDDDDLSWTERVSVAEGLELALTGTVHSVGRRLLERYALELGLSPRLSVLDRETAERRMNDIIAEMTGGVWDELGELSRALQVDDVRELVLDLLQEKRTNRIEDEDFLRSMEEGAERVCEMLAPDGPDPGAPGPTQLATLAEDALARINAIDDETNDTQKVRDELSRYRRVRNPTWKDIVCAGQLEAGASSDDELDEIRSFASQVRLMRGLHEDIREFARTVGEQVIAVQERYETYKRERGLLDFRDLEIQTLRALRTEPIREDIGSSLDVVFVDEFQDSNPIQLAIFIELHRAVGESYWVGDPKQSIYRFRDADLDLAESAWELVNEANIDPLGTCFRSQEGLVEFFNCVFPEVFGSSAELEPDRTDDGASLERWFLDSGNRGEDVAAIAAGIEQLIEEGEPVGDIAVLAQDGWHARRIAEALEERDIPSIVPRPGLLDTREGALVEAGLRLVADPRDSLAAAEVLHFLGDPEEGTPDWLRRRLEQVQDGHDGDAFAGTDPLPELRAIPAEDRSPTEVVQAVAQSLDLPSRVASWGRPETRSANLDRFVEMADEYQQLRKEQGRGVSLRGFLAWLEDVSGEGEDEVATPTGLDAVSVRTYYKAKGLEWPTVVLTHLDKVHPPDPWEPEVVGGRAEEGRPLQGRRLRYWPWPFGRTWRPYGRDPRTEGTGLEAQAHETEAGRRIAREVENEARRLLYVGMTRAEDRLVIAHRGSPEEGRENTDWLDLLPLDGVLGPYPETGEFEHPEAPTTVRVRALDPGNIEDGDRVPPAIEILAGGAGEERPPAFRSPSDQLGATTAYRASTESLADLEAVERPRTDGWEAVGNALHRYLAGLPSMVDSGRDHRLERAKRCLSSHDVESDLRPETLVDAGDRLLAWVADEFPGANLMTEVPVVAAGHDGGRWSGEIDLLLETEGGELVVVDHKARPIPEEMWAGEAQGHAGQIDAYRQALETLGRDVGAGYVHFPFGGGIVELTEED